MKCSNNLKQLAIAAHAFHDVNGSFPSWTGANSINLWIPRLMPYFEQNTLAQPTTPTSTVLARTDATLSVLQCPSASVQQPYGPYGGRFYGITNYLAVTGRRYSDWSRGGDTGIMAVWPSRIKVTMTGVGDGTSNTLLIGERGPASGAGGA